VVPKHEAEARIKYEYVIHDIFKNAVGFTEEQDSYQYIETLIRSDEEDVRRAMLAALACEPES
jgi:hypothetical protein